MENGVTRKQLGTFLAPKHAAATRPSTTLLGICPRATETTCTDSVQPLQAAGLRTAPTCKQPRCPSTSERWATCLATRRAEPLSMQPPGQSLETCWARTAATAPRCGPTVSPGKTQLETTNRLTVASGQEEVGVAEGRQLPDCDTVLLFSQDVTMGAMGEEWAGSFHIILCDNVLLIHCECTITSK